MLLCQHSYCRATADLLHHSASLPPTFFTPTFPPLQKAWIHTNTHTHTPAMHRPSSTLDGAGGNDAASAAKRACTDGSAAGTQDSNVPFWMDSTFGDPSSSSEEDEAAVINADAASVADTATSDVLFRKSSTLRSTTSVLTAASTQEDLPATQQQQPDSPPSSQPPSPTPQQSVGSVPFTAMRCQKVTRYVKEGKISEGGYGVVTKAKDRATGRRVALKRIKFGTGQGRAEDGVHISALREITTLLSISHSNIVKIYEAVTGENHDELFLVMEFVEHDVRKLITPQADGGLGHKFTQTQVKCVMRQLLTAIGYLHDRWVIHRDLKTNNLLYGNNGVLKLCDFGMARLSGEPIRPYTPLQWVLTLPFRPPEGLLGTKEYDERIDMWGVGCVFAELLECRPLFRPGNHCPEVDMLDQIFALCGTPSQKEWADLDPLLRQKHPDPFIARVGDQRIGLNIENYALKRARGSRGNLADRFATLLPTAAGQHLLTSLLCVNPADRMNATDAFHHEFFTEAPEACSPTDMPNFTVS